MAQKVILYIAESVDGYIARKDGRLDWLTPYEGQAEDYGYADFLKTIGTVIMGHTTYRQVLSFGDFPYPEQACFVFSTDRSKERDEHVTFVRGNVAESLDRIRDQHTGDIWLVGGSILIDAFLKQDLIDEFIITTVPVLLGDGIPLFLPSGTEKSLHLVSVRSYAAGLVQTRYIRG